jgi:integral membrane sensor domain MASE1
VHTRGSSRLRAWIGEDWRIYVAKIVVLAGVYYGGAKLGLALAFETASVTAVWPPTGIALAALVLGGYRFWPGIALGALIANATTGGIPIYSALGITVGNTMEAVVGAYLLLRLVDFRPSLERVRDVLALAGLAAVVSTTVSASIGVASLLAGNEIEAGEFGSVWRTWWLGDMSGDLVVAPALMVAAARWPFRAEPERLLEGIGLALLTGGVAALVFTRSANLTFLIIPLLIWACLRFRQPGAVAISLLTASIAIPLTESDLGPFSGNSPDERLLLAQAYLGTVSLTGLVLAAVVTERQRVEDSLANIAGTLQESLLPHPPDIPGIEVALDFRPAAKGQLVGGDFYDWFRNDDETWSLAIGDVAGKGASAAAAAGLARYTIRAAAIQEPRPSRVLELLNDAVLRQSPGQTCTAVFARFGFDGGGSVRVTLSVGGHPQPLVLRSDGAVEPVGLGTILGMADAPGLGDYGVDLGSGDALVLHTDGLTDAFAPAHAVSPAELSEALRACAGRSARGIVEGIEAAILQRDDGAEPRDDIVLLVLRLPAAPERRWSHPAPAADPAGVST